MVVAVEPRGEFVICEWIPRSPAYHHQEVDEVNPDASLCFADRGKHERARRVCGDLDDLIDSVVLLRAAPGVGTSERNLARSRCCRDRSRSRSAPARGNARIEKTAPLYQPVGPRHTGVDETRHGWDTAPAYVLCTMWGAAPIRTGKVGIGAAPVLNEDRDLAHLLQLAV